MGNLVQPFTKGAQDADFLANLYDGIRFVAPLYESRHTSLSVARQPRHHAQFLALGQLYYQVCLFELEFRRRLNEGPRSLAAPSSLAP
jgi:hypothetical protein